VTRGSLATPVGARALVAAELLKIRSTRAALGLMIGMVALALIALAGTLAAYPAEVRLDTDDGIGAVLGLAGVAGNFSLLLGVLSSTGELRHGTAVQAFLAVPSRLPVLLAKVAACALVGLLFAAVSGLICLAVGLPWLASRGQAVSLFDPTVWRVLGGAGLAAALYGALGVGLGSLVRRQGWALAVAVGWFLVAETVLLVTQPDLAQWLPGGAASALAGAGAGLLLPAGVGGLLLAAYATAFVGAGGWRLDRGEIG